MFKSLVQGDDLELPRKESKKQAGDACERNKKKRIKKKEMKRKKPVFEVKWYTHSPSCHKGGPNSEETEREVKNYEREYPILFENLIDVPNDVIEHVLLKFIEIEVTDEHESEEFDLFGYFEYDQSRRIFFLFNSIYLKYPGSKPRICKTIISWKNVENFVLELKRYIGYNDKEPFERIIKEADLSNLRSFTYYTHNDCFKSTVDTPFGVFHGKNFPNLERLFICGASVYNPKQAETTKLPPMPKLKRLEVISCCNLGNRLMKCNDFSSVEELIVGDSGESGKDWKPIQNIRSLDLSQSGPIAMMTDSMFSESSSSSPFTTLEKLEKLRIHNCEGLKGEGWMKTDHLKQLILFRNNNFSDTFFQEQAEYLKNSLKIIELIEAKGVSGKGWKTMNSLKILYLRGCLKFEDEFFQENTFPSLIFLDIYRLPLVTGQKWKFMKKLQVFLVKNCEKMVKKEELEKVVSKEICKHFDTDCRYGNWSLKRLMSKYLED